VTSDAQGGTRLLWIGFVLPPLASLANLELSYVLASRGCGAGAPERGLLLLLAAAAFAVAASGAVLAWRGIDRPAEPPESARARSFLALCGLLSSAFFALVILAMALPAALLRPCD
jgi:hypothetical protein